MKQHIENTEKCIRKLKRQRNQVIQSDPNDPYIHKLTREIKSCNDLVIKLLHRLEKGGHNERRR